MNISDLKIAFAGASHWHVPIYLPAVESEKLKVVGFSDPRKDVADRFAAKYGCASYCLTRRSRILCLPLMCIPECRSLR